VLKQRSGSLRRYEPLWNEYGVDLLLFGHVHAYERTNPVANYTADPTGCAPTYITIGEGSAATPVRFIRRVCI